MSPWSPDYCDEKANEINRISAPKEISYQNRVEREQKGYSKRGWLPTSHGRHVLSTLPGNPGTGNQFLRSTPLSYLCDPSASLPQGQATPQAMAQHGARAVGRYYWDHPLALQAGAYPSKASPIPHQCPPTTPQAVSSHPFSQARETHKNHLDTEPVQVAPHCSIGSSGADNHSLCYHEGRCFLTSYANQDGVWVNFICLKHWHSRK